jgi:hypothetical protein
LPPTLLLFDRSKPFYPLVVHYVVLLWAFKELAAHGVGELVRGSGGVPDEMELDHETLESILSTPFAELMPPLELASAAVSDTLSVDIAEIAQDMAMNHHYLLGQTLPSAGGALLIAAYETTKTSTDRGQVWEFFRHCRNAAAHRGRFELRGQEPTRPARWRNLEILPSMVGSPLFHGLDEPGLLRPADPVRLLWDIEQTL